MPEKKLDFYNTHHPAWRPAPDVAIPIQQEDPMALVILPLVVVEPHIRELLEAKKEKEEIKLSPVQVVEPTMSPRCDIKKAVEENAKQRKIEATKKRAKEIKAEEAKKMELGRKIKEENVEKNKNKKWVTIKESLDIPRKTSRATEEDLKAKKKQKVDQSQDLMILDPLASDKVPLATSSDALRTSRPPPPPQQRSFTTHNEGSSRQVLLETVFLRDPVRDSTPFIPQILIPRLEFPFGRPFTIQGSALNHLEYYLKGIFLPATSRVQEK